MSAASGSGAREHASAGNGGGALLGSGGAAGGSSHDASAGRAPLTTSEPANTASNESHGCACTLATTASERRKIGVLVVGLALLRVARRRRRAA